MFEIGLPYLKPSELSIISQIIVDSGTIIEIGRKRDFKLSGSSDLPAYPGFIVMKIAHWSLRGIVEPSKLKVKGF